MKLILFAVVLSVSCQWIVDTQGTMENMGGAKLILPEFTYLRNETDTQLDLLQELRWLRRTVEQQQVQISQLLNRTACGWQGIRCQCFYKYSASASDIAILLGTNCTNGKIESVRILNMLIASSIGGCIFNTTEICDEVES